MLTDATLSPDAVAVIELDAQLVVANRQRFKIQVVDAIHGGARRFVLDFAACAYVDTSGLGVLISIAKKVRDVAGTLVLCGLNEDLLNLFHLSHIDTLFVIVATKADALALVAHDS